MNGGYLMGMHGLFWVRRLESRRRFVGFMGLE